MWRALHLSARILLDFHEREVDQSLDGIHARDDHVHTRAKPEPALARAAHPGTTAGLHDVFVVAQIVEMQQAIDADRGELHECTELHYRGDQSFEGLADTIAQVN